MAKAPVPLSHQSSNDGARMARELKTQLAAIERFIDRIKFGEGSPEGRIGAPHGTLYINTDGGLGTTLWVKEANGSGKTGWFAK